MPGDVVEVPQGDLLPQGGGLGLGPLVGPDDGGPQGVALLSTHRHPIIWPEKETAAMSPGSMRALSIRLRLVTQMAFQKSSGSCSAQLVLK